MSKKIVWRLASLPTASELQVLVAQDIISKDEARAILLNFEEVTDRDKKSFESEIKFLRELVEKLSTNSTKVIENIRYIEKPYSNYPWYQPYMVWCNTVDNKYYCENGTSTGKNYTTGYASVAQINGGTGTNLSLVNTSNNLKLSDVQKVMYNKELDDLNKNKTFEKFSSIKTF